LRGLVTPLLYAKLSKLQKMLGLGRRALPALLGAALLDIAAASTIMSASSNGVLWTGRTWVNSTSGGVLFDWTGVSAEVTVSGSTNLTALFVSTWLEKPARESESSSTTAEEGRARSLQDSSFPKFAVYRVFVDGAVWGPDVTVFPGTAELPLAVGLDPTTSHRVRIQFLTDAVYDVWPDMTCLGCAQSIQFFRTDSAFGPRPSAPTRSLFFIGDSITAGNAIYHPCTNASTADFSISYGQLLCDAFNASCVAAVASSKGLLVNCCDDENVTVPDLMQRTLVEDPTPSMAWNWKSQAAPDGIIVALGTNDSGKVGKSASLIAAFEARYVQLLVNLTSIFAPSKPAFFLAVGPITEEYLPWVTSAAATAQSQYGINTTLVNFAGCPLDGCGHPGVQGHAEMAKIAQPVMAQVLGW
jgi:lysophospholipase L1-like esterase